MFLCRYPGCGRTFAFRQGMSRHMRRVHRVSARDYKNVESSSGDAPSFSQEAVVRESFQGADSGAQEALLAACALQEIMANMPTYDTLVVAGEPFIPDRQLKDASAIYMYAFPDLPDVGSTLPTSQSPIITRGGPRRGAPSSTRTRGVGRIRRVASSRAPARHFPALPHAVSRGKDIRRDFEHLLETSLWSSQPARFTHGDLVKVMEAFPGASSVEMAISTTRHFEASRAQAKILRRRFAAMVVLEQNMIARVRRLLPVDGDPSSAVQAVRDIDALCQRYEGRNTSLPFE